MPGEPVFHGWLRWSGGVIIAFGIGAILTYLKPKGQGIFVTTIAIGALLAGVAMLCGSGFRPVRYCEGLRE